MCVCQRYLDEAEREKVQYAKELKEYQQSEAYQITTAKIQDKKVKRGEACSSHTHLYIHMHTHNPV